MDTKGEVKTQVISEEDDFDLTVLANKQKAKKEDGTGEEEEKKEEEEKSVTGEEKIEEDEIEKEEIQKAEEGTEEVEDDFFAEKEAATEEKPGTVDFNSLAKQIGIEDEVKDDKTFSEAVKKAINGAKQKVDLSGYSEDAQKLIEHLNEKKGDIATFFENPVITQMNRVLALDPETKLREVRYTELIQELKDEDKAIEQLESEMEEMSKGEIKSAAENIDNQAKELRKSEITKIIGEGESKVKQQQNQTAEQKAKETQNIKNYIDKQDKFFGLNLTKEAKSTILKDIDNGKFDEIVGKTPEASKFFAYMVGKYGDKISEKMSKVVTDANRQGHNAAQDKQFDALHKTKPSGAGSTGHNKGSENKRNFDKLTDDLF